MASNAPVPASGPLSMMSKISPNSFIYRPSGEATPTKTSSVEPPSPRLILVCSWMGARDQHIAKYIVRYQSTYPTAQILLVKCEIFHIRDPARAAREIQPVVPALRAVFGDDSTSMPAATSSTPELLVHLFSNGGSSMLHHLYKAYRPSPLPRHVTVFDSAPGQYSYRGSFAAMTAGLSRTWKSVLTPVIHIFILYYVFNHFVLPWNRNRGDPLARWAAAHNDRAINAGEARRAYIFSKGDKLVGADAVEAHGEEAKRKGFDVRMENFVDSEHVAHMRADEERYWRIVDETWRGSS